MGKEPRSEFSYALKALALRGSDVALFGTMYGIPDKKAAATLAECAPPPGETPIGKVIKYSLTGQISRKEAARIVFEEKFGPLKQKNEKKKGTKNDNRRKIHKSSRR